MSPILRALVLVTGLSFMTVPAEASARADLANMVERPARRAQPAPPALRAAAAVTTYEVTSAGDGGDADVSDGACRAADGQCTLRAAIEAANVSPGPDVVAFAIGSGAVTIEPESARCPASSTR